ncbi:T9SS type A sorting domain-containing protein [Algibacter sp. L1A34]|uniref:T9SS type A sorting domain-containing protein n=1 Tax=Algibacter sp. L1A34 TaxID=2686365 RepID=UPI00131E1B01|nr:T9SS type A sorting domain-containing protein [Algibacter sp. L1A34]
MKHKNTIMSTAFIILGLGGLSAQETIPASGGDASGSKGSSSYTVGQMVYTTNSGSGSVTQGVQQSIEFFTLSNPELTTVNLTAITYPNPTSDYLVLAISDAKLTALSFKLYDLQGRTVAQGQVNQSTTQIDMQSLALGIYVLKVNQNNQELKTFKIIKE